MYTWIGENVDHVLHLNSLDNSYQYSEKSDELKSGDSIDIFLSIHLSGNNTIEYTFLIINFPINIQFKLMT